MDNNELYEYVKELKTDIRDVKNDVRDVKSDVKNVKEQVEEVYEEVIKINGRLDSAEREIKFTKEETTLRRTECAKRMDSLTPNVPLLKYLNLLSKKPKLAMLIIIGFIVTVQTVVLHAIQNGWIKKLIDLILKI